MIKTIGIKTHIEKHETHLIKVDNFYVVQKVINDRVVSQEWRCDKKISGFLKTHPKAYEPHRMRFYYYEDISFLDNEEENDTGIPYWDYVPEPSIINWENFKGLDHVLCIYLGDDGNIYKINSQKPIPIWRHFNYINSLSNTDCDLEVAVRRISKLRDVKNVKIVEIPYYNRSKDTHAIEFDYKRPTEKDIHKELNKFYPKKYFI